MAYLISNVTQLLYVLGCVLSIPYSTTHTHTVTDIEIIKTLVRIVGFFVMIKECKGFAELKYSHPLCFVCM